MRLIDSIPIIKFIENGMNNPNRAEAFGSDATEILAEIMIAPTVNPEDCRPHRWWIWNEENECWVCSNCESSALNNYRGNSTDSDYCPHCGAKMSRKEYSSL